MASIPKAFHALEKREMSISEYQHFLETHPYQTSVRALKCVECGDILTYCNGDSNIAYFKHSPTHEGHSYCSLYKEGKESKTNEANLRRKLIREQDISLNFELLNRDGKWESLITFPPFRKEEIEINERKHTHLIIGEGRNAIDIEIKSSIFQSGLIKKIGLNDFPKSIQIRIDGDTALHNMSFDIDGFDPNNQIYSSLIMQNYCNQTSSFTIDMKNAKIFACKKITGDVFVGRHYIIFSSKQTFGNDYLYSDSISVKKIDFEFDSNFRFFAYDIIFNKKTPEALEFCSKRNCDLIDRNDAVIIWPPVRSVGNYRYYKKDKEKMIISFQNENLNKDIKMIDLLTADSKVKIFFQIENLNSPSFYVTSKKQESISKSKPEINSINNQNVSKKYEKIFVLRKNVLLSKEDKLYKIKRNEQILFINDALDKAFYKPNINNGIDDEILNSIRYSRKYIPFSDKNYDFLYSKYKNNKEICWILDYYKAISKIKEKTLMLLIEGASNEN